MAEAIARPVDTKVELGRLTTFNQLVLSVFWFATSFHWAAILIVLLPSQVLRMVGNESKGTGASAILAMGAVIAALLPPFAGAYSDRLASRLGRRRPLVIAGVLINVFALAGLAIFHTFWAYACAFALAEFGNTMATAPYSALIPDMVPVAQRGSASGWLGLMTALGQGVGIVFAGAFVDARSTAEAYQSQVGLVYGVIIAVMLLGLLVTVLGIQEKDSRNWGRTQFDPWRVLRSLWIDPRKYPDFAWVFLTRFIWTMGQYSVQPFLQFYILDTLPRPYQAGFINTDTPESAVSFVLLGLLLLAIVSSLVGGRLSDRYGRKAIVYAAGYITAIVAIGLVLVHSYALALLLGAVFGIGYGAYTSVDWALATDVLPNPDDFAKDMGVWHIAQTVPQSVGGPVAGILLDRFQIIGRSTGSNSLGYTVIFGLAAVYFLLGTIFVSRIRKAR